MKIAYFHLFNHLENAFDYFIKCKHPLIQMTLIIMGISNMVFYLSRLIQL